MAQNIKDVASSFRLPTGYVSGKTPAIYPPNKYLEDDVRMNPKRKYIYNGQPVITPKIPLSPVIRENKFDEHSRYLALFTQFSIIEDSFEFVHLTFHFDPFQCVYAGSFFEKIYGYSCKEIYENSGLFYEIAHPDDAGFLMEQIKRLIRNGYNEFSYRIIAKTGEVKYLKTNCWCQQDENFSLVISCYQKDITSQIETDRDTGKSNKKRHYISDIAVTLNSIDNFEEKLQSVVDKIGSVISNDQVNLYEIDDDLNHMVCRYIWVKQDTIIPPGVIVDVPPLSIMPDYINSFRFSLDEDVSGFMHYWNRQINVQSILVVPIRIKQRIFGFIELISTNHKRKLNDHDRGFIETIGNMVANFYDRKKISDELNLNHLKQELLANVSSRLNQYTDNKEHVMQSVLNYIGLKKPDTERIFIYRYCENRGVFLKTYEYVNSTFNVKYNSREEYDSMLFSEIITMLKAGKSYFVNDIAELKSTLQLVLQQLHVKSILLIPMFINGEFYGVYGYYIYSHYHIWRKNEIEIAQSFAGVISHSIERQEITKKLQDSENKFKNISEKLPGCVFQVTLSPAGEIRLNYISPQVEQWLGYKPTSKSSLEKIRQSIHPDDSEAFSRFAQEIKLLHTEVSFECRFFFSAKGFKWLIVKATLSEIRPLGECVYNGLLIDITENKQTELKLAEAGVSIQSIINNLGSGILLVDDRDNVLYINRPLLDMLADAGVYNARSESQDGILKATYDLVRDSAGLEKHTAGLMKNRSEERDRELFFYKSAEFVNRNYIPIFRDQRFFAHLFIFNNITQTKMQELEINKSYKRVRTIIDYSDMGVLLLSNNEKVLIVNGRFLKMLQIEEATENFTNQPFVHLWDRMTKTAVVDGIQLDDVRKITNSSQYVVRDICINGTNTFKCFIEPITDDSLIGTGIHETLIQLIDITSQKNIEQTLRKAKEEAEVIANAKSHILTSMSHEIRTPLNGILGFTSLLKETLTDPYHREMAEVIDQSGNRLMDTLNAILDFSLVQSDTKSFKISSVSVNKMVQEQINLYGPMALQKDLYLYAEIRGKISISTSEMAFIKTIQNLVNNAIKYTKSGGVKIEAGITHIGDNDWLDIKVIDTGVGIDEVMHQRIFEPFRQESEGYGRAFEGTGLGLSFVKEYLQKIGGKISLTSRKDEGSVFTVLLPNAYLEDSDASLRVVGIPPK